MVPGVTGMHWVAAASTGPSKSPICAVFTPSDPDFAAPCTSNGTQRSTAPLFESHPLTSVLKSEFTVSVRSQSAASPTKCTQPTLLGGGGWGAPVSTSPPPASSPYVTGPESLKYGPPFASEAFARLPPSS